ncbi:hypothetical protein F7725_021074 [Dissostichus mawsoni]|uniref:Zinc finger and BTB domain containing 38 n=1 Tax=Dissostichus mawsoni TaxID=36200 RepID=A0A7J5YEZ9_DISMA|nr:hypothetical protein F7725_021074 [Dissostichus mawsoni]
MPHQCEQTSWPRPGCLSESAIFSCRRASAAPRLPRPEPRRLKRGKQLPGAGTGARGLLACAPPKAGDSAGGDSLRFLVDFLKPTVKIKGLEVSGLEDPGKDSLGFGRLTLGLKRAAHSNLEELAALACSLSRVLRRGEGLEAERERRALEEEEVEAEEEESVTLLHPALAEAADFDASLVGFAVLPSVRLGRGPAVLLRPGRESAFFRFGIGEAPAAPLFLLWPRPDDAGGSEASDRFLDFAGPFLVSEVLSLGAGSALGFLAGVGPKQLGPKPRQSGSLIHLFAGAVYSRSFQLILCLHTPLLHSSTLWVRDAAGVTQQWQQPSRRQLNTVQSGNQNTQTGRARMMKRSQGLFCDVTIVVEDVKFRAHKNILAACSGYFRNALTTPETWSSDQVLELMDLKSEVFASILNFIYCSKVTSPGVEDTRVLVAAGKRLGIPFLEKLAEQERQDQCVKSTDGSKATVSIKTKQEASRPEDIDRGPRITNAFSINEVCSGTNLFTPLVQTKGERQSPEVGQLPSSSPTTSCLNVNNETTHALSEHSYAVIKSFEGKDSSQWDNKKVFKPAISQSKQLSYRNAGPLKKRHRLRLHLCRSILPRPAESQADKPNTKPPTEADGVSKAPVAVMTPPPLSSEAETEKCKGPGLPIATDNVQMELDPPTRSPHTEESISIYGCEQCPEIFTNQALLAVHSEVHKKRFISHLFCKFCHKKFIHLKRLRNHEQVCPKAVRSSPKQDSSDISTKEVELHSDSDEPNTESNTIQLPSADLSTPQPLEMDQSEPSQDEKAVRPGGSQRRYNCSVCKRVYITLSSLKRHENVHSWQRAYPCHYCNKVFALAEYRTKHEIWHTGERRYQCIFCLETFMTYYILKNHQKSFHGIDPNLAVKKNQLTVV